MDEAADAVVGPLVSIVSRLLAIPVEQVPTDASLRDGLNVDSLQILEIILAVESRFKVSIPDAEVGRFAYGSIDDAAAWLRANAFRRPPASPGSGH